MFPTQFSTLAFLSCALLQLAELQKAKSIVRRIAASNSIEILGDLFLRLLILVSMTFWECQQARCSQCSW